MFSRNFRSQRTYQRIAVLAADLAVFVSVSRVDGHGRTLEHLGWTGGSWFA